MKDDLAKAVGELGEALFEAIRHCEKRIAALEQAQQDRAKPVIREEASVEEVREVISALGIYGVNGIVEEMFNHFHITKKTNDEGHRAR